MPNRIIRDGILTSDRVNQIADDPATEVFYRRLHSVVDDFGRYSANPALLRAALYPLRLDKVSESAIAGYITACEAARLLVTYQVDGKTFMELADFRQRTRATHSKYPARGGHMTVIGQTDDGQNHMSLITKNDRHGSDECPTSDRHMRTETETETETETLFGGADETRATGLHAFLAAYPKKTKTDAAARAYVSVIESDQQHAELMAGLERWKGSDQWTRSLEGDGGRFVPDPDKFIFERRWLESPAAYRENAATNGKRDPFTEAAEILRRKAG